MYLVTLLGRIIYFTSGRKCTMNSNVFSIDSNVVVSEKTSRD
jgi:hypothetical protein